MITFLLKLFGSKINTAALALLVINLIEQVNQFLATHDFSHMTWQQTANSVGLFIIMILRSFYNKQKIDVTVNKS